VYGIVDSGIVVDSGGPKGSELKLESGVSSFSRIGFRGSEALGDGMAAIFTLESGIQNDTGALAV
jgi:predicted porin